jgi:hypothetical protein
LKYGALEKEWEGEKEGKMAFTFLLFYLFTFTSGSATGADTRQLSGVGIA